MKTPLCEITFAYPSVAAGITYCEVILPTGEALVGWAQCHEGDRFEKRLGRKIAFTRAIESQSRQFRRSLWESFHAFVKV